MPDRQPRKKRGFLLPGSGHAAVHNLGRHLVRAKCSGQLFPDSELSFSSATAGARPSLNAKCSRLQNIS
jgi:hypothetical protein